MSTHRRTLSRASYYLHLWGGVVATVSLVVIAVTGVLLNHKRPLGLMPDVPGVADALPSALGLDSLAAIAVVAAGAEARVGGRAAAIDRMDVRPRSGYVKVRLRDPQATEVTIALASGRVLHVGPRRDVYLEQLHSGEVFGSWWVLLSDVAALLLVLTLITGLWLWIAPRLASAPVSEQRA
jgi:hypothetical protein